MKFMKLEEINNYLDKIDSKLNVQSYGECDRAEINYYKKNISDIRRAINGGKLPTEKLTEEILRDFINDGLDIGRVIDEQITPEDAVKNALSTTSPARTEEARTVEESAYLRDEKEENQI